MQPTSWTVVKRTSFARDAKNIVLTPAVVDIARDEASAVQSEDIQTMFLLHYSRLKEDGQSRQRSPADRPVRHIIIVI